MLPLQKPCMSCSDSRKAMVSLCDGLAVLGDTPLKSGFPLKDQQISQESLRSCGQEATFRSNGASESTGASNYQAKACKHQPSPSTPSSIPLLSPSFHASSPSLQNPIAHSPRPQYKKKPRHWSHAETKTTRQSRETLIVHLPKGQTSSRCSGKGRREGSLGSNSESQEPNVPAAKTQTPQFHLSVNSFPKKGAQLCNLLGPRTPISKTARQLPSIGMTLVRVLSG